MVLVDTSVWIQHFRKGHPRLTTLLDSGAVACHDFIIGELACGRIGNRKEILSLLGALPKAEVAEFTEVLFFIEENQLEGLGLGFVDVSLLASTRITNIPIWTLDKKLRAVANRLKVLFEIVK